MHRRRGIVCLAALGSLLICGSTAPPGCSTGRIGPSNAEVVGGIVGVAAAITVATVVLVEVNKSHHTIKGCVTAGPDGLTLHTEGNTKTYALTGVTASAKVGDVVKLHGNKEKGQKDSAGDQDFRVEKMSRDYGPCQASIAPPSASAQQ